MQFNLEQLAEQALKLPVESRALLADRLVESLEIVEPDEMQKLWAAEAVRRRTEVISGQVAPIDGDQALAEVRRAIGL